MINLTEEEIMKDWPKGSVKPMVSICGITYNHEKYIEEALDSFLMQRTNFAFDIVFSDDKSPDSTQKILKKYIDKFPNIMNVNLGTVNVGSMKNFESNMERATGKYIAVCEGDDFWIDEMKLQKQVSFLESNSEYSGCFHDSINYEMHEDGSVFEELRIGSRSIESDVDLASIIFENNIATASIMYRNTITEYPEFFLQTTKGDYALMVMIAEQGLIKYIPEVMSKYRIHTGGVWSLKSQSYQVNEGIKFYLLLQENFVKNLSISKEIHKKLQNEYFNMALVLLRENKVLESIKFFKKVFFNFDQKHKNIRYIKYFKELIRHLLGKHKNKKIKA